MSQQEAPGWMVITARPMAEELAENTLKAAGWRVYLPRGRKVLRGIRIDPQTRKRIRTRGFGEIVMRPIFAGYLFVELHPGQSWAPALAQRGVIGMLASRVGDGMRPKLVTERGIEALRSAERDGEFDEARCRRGKANHRPDLEIGARVAVEISGITLDGIIESLSDKRDQAIVRYMLFGRASRTHIGTKMLELVAA